MIVNIIKYFNNLIQNSAQNPSTKLLCNPNLCNYSPHTINGPCRFCYGNQGYNIKN